MILGNVNLSQRGRLQWFCGISMLLLTLNACDSGAQFKSADSLKTGAQKALEEKN